MGPWYLQEGPGKVTIEQIAYYCGSEKGCGLIRTYAKWYRNTGYHTLSLKNGVFSLVQNLKISDPNFKLAVRDITWLPAPQCACACTTDVQWNLRIRIVWEQSFCPLC